MKIDLDLIAEFGLTEGMILNQMYWNYIGSKESKIKIDLIKIKKSLNIKDKSDTELWKAIDKFAARDYIKQEVINSDYYYSIEPRKFYEKQKKELLK